MFSMEAEVNETRGQQDGDSPGFDDGPFSLVDEIGGDTQTSAAPRLTSPTEDNRLD